LVISSAFPLSIGCGAAEIRQSAIFVEERRSQPRYSGRESVHRECTAVLGTQNTPEDVLSVSGWYLDFKGAVFMSEKAKARKLEVGSNWSTPTTAV
jgi:hypothetical protein